MHFHLPKPMHGWREFTGEISIIVIGVLIALGAEQVVEAIHRRTVVQETRDAIRQEFDLGLATLVVRHSIEPCIDRRLDELRTILGEWNRTGDFPTSKWVAQAPSEGIDLTRYDAAVSAGNMTLLPSSEQYQIGSIADALRNFDQIQGDERPLWGRLRALQAGAKDLSEGDRSALRMALQDASRLNYQAALAGYQILELAREYGFRPDLSEFNRTIRRTLKGSGYKPSICWPIDTPPEVANRYQAVPLSL